MPGRWSVSFESSDRLRDRERRHSAPVSSHPCARGDECSASTAATVDGETALSPALALTSAPWCQKDRNRAYRSLTAMPELWVRLHMEIGNKGQGGEHVSMTRAAPIPLRADIDALLREHLFILSSWDERLRLAERMSLPDTQEQQARTDHGRQVAQFAATLAAHLDRLLCLPAEPMTRSFDLRSDLSHIPEGAPGRTNRIGGYTIAMVDLSGTDAGEEILRLNYRARSVLGETRMRERLDVPCPDPACDMLMLERVQGSDYTAECKACGRLLTDAEYKTWVKLYANSLSGAEIQARKGAA